MTVTVNIYLFVVKKLQQNYNRTYLSPVSISEVSK